MIIVIKTYCLVLCMIKDFNIFFITNVRERENPRENCLSLGFSNAVSKILASSEMCRGKKHVLSGTQDC